MDTIESRSESRPSSPSFNQKNQMTNGSDTIDEGEDDTKPKKRSLRSNQRTQINGKENKDSNTLDNVVTEEHDMPNQNECNGNHLEKTDEKESTISTIENIEKNLLDGTEENAEVIVSETIIYNETLDKSVGHVIEATAEDIPVNVTDLEKENCSSTVSIETESSSHDDSMTENSNMNELHVTETENLSLNGANDAFSLSNTPAYGINGESGKSVSEEDSFYDVEIPKEENVQDSPDTATKENSFSNKLSNFLGKLNSPFILQDHKQDLEITSSKRGSDSEILTYDGKPVMHPYLSKVTGRPGIKGRANLTPSFTKSSAVETPTYKNMSLSDSFRVKTDPPRLNQIKVDENPVLKKYKGKRCLNVNDELEDNEDIRLSSTKRRKLDETTYKSGLLGGILWSPFKKRCFQENSSAKLSTTPSRLSRFLGPFWFWKKTSASSARM